MFENFNASKQQQLDRYERLVLELEKTWSENPILPSLKEVVSEAKNLWS